ncbi:DNA-3-methyladenine glycosylase 2 family protein [Kytococcus sedentarius]|uniref:DNA-3-methyladenine glycosylase 2 family protein n=1 Tax=Kytococcus sedentarius TaxID=1276 RepID=UPI0035BBEC56
MNTDHAACCRIVASRDARFDGEFVTAVHTTGIYCRPSCPARTPQPQNMSFHPTAAAAQAAGFRACKRCRPDASPGSAQWDLRTDVAGRAVRLIRDGLVDREGVEGLARAVGYSRRQVERLLLAEAGASPLALARAQRAHTARVLLETTDLPLAQVAFAAGFGSVRSFNAVLQQTYATAPRDLRARRRGAGATTPDQPAAPVTLPLRLAFRRPLEPQQLFGHLAATAVPGVEAWREGALHRTLDLPGAPGLVSARPPDPTASHVDVMLTLLDPADLTAAVARVRHWLDLDADPVAVAEALGGDPHLGPLVATSPGRRVPGCVDGPEQAVRVVVGQQVSTAGARTVTARLVQETGTPLPLALAPLAAPLGLTHTFARPETIAARCTRSLAESPHLAMPRARVRAVLALSDAVSTGQLDLSPGADRAAAREALGRLSGIGPWTTEMVALRCLGDPDAFPATDLGVRRAAESLDAGPLTGRSSTAAERWRPWRAYAVQYLWSLHDHPINHLPPDQDDAVVPAAGDEGDRP